MKRLFCFFKLETSIYIDIEIVNCYNFLIVKLYNLIDDVDRFVNVRLSVLFYKLRFFLYIVILVLNEFS